MLTELMDALADLEDEIYRAQSLHPGNDQLFPALIEECGEVAKAVQEGDFMQARAEALHVACVALRLYIDGDASWKSADNAENSAENA